MLSLECICIFVVMSGLELNKVHLGDVRDLLSKIDHDSISLSVWSPPYFVGKNYEKYLSYEDWVELLNTTIQKHFLILKPGGFLVVNIADILCFPDDTIPKFQSLNKGLQKVKITKEDVLKAKQQYPHYTRNQLAKLLGCSEQTIDRRLNGNNIRGGKHQTMTRVHLVGGQLEKSAYESGLILYDRRIWRKDPAWQNSKWHNSSYRSVDEFEYLYFFWKPGETEVDRERLSSDEWKKWGSRAVWEFPSVRANNDHEAKFPLELPYRIIKLLTTPDDIVLDCFMGSGTTAVAAIDLDRKFLGIELVPEYVELAERNINIAFEAKKQLKLI